MTTPTFTIDDDGARVDWHVRAACVWRSDFQSIVDGVPENITGYTFTARITSGPTSSTALKTFTSTISAATDGRWYISIADSSADLSSGTYWWAMEVDPGTGDEPLMSGLFIVSAWAVA